MYLRIAYTICVYVCMRTAYIHSCIFLYACTYVRVCVYTHTPYGFCLSGEPSLIRTLMTIEHLLFASQGAKRLSFLCLP